MARRSFVRLHYPLCHAQGYGWPKVLKQNVTKTKDSYMGTDDQVGTDDYLRFNLGLI